MRLPAEVLSFEPRGPRTILAFLWLTMIEGGRAGELEAHLDGRADAPFLALTVDAVRDGVGLKSRSVVHEHLRVLQAANQIRRDVRIVDGRPAWGWAITPPWAAPAAPALPPIAPRLALPAAPLVLDADGKGPPEAEAILDDLFARRRALGLTPRRERGPTTQAELDALAAPMRSGATWADWRRVVLQQELVIRQQAAARAGSQDESEIRRLARHTGEAGFFTVGRLCQQRFTTLIAQRGSAPQENRT